MGGVADFVGDVVGDVVDFVGDVAEDVVQVAGDAVSDVADTIGSTVERALDDPIGTIATIAAVATGNAYLIPYINAANTVAQGGDIGDAVKAGAISYAAGQVGAATGEYFGGGAGSVMVDDFGIPLLPADAAYNAATQTGMGFGSTVGNVAANTAGAATGAVLSGGDPMQAILGSLTAQGVRAGVNAAGQIISDTGEVLYNSATDYFNQTADQPGDFPTTMDDLIAADTQLGGMPSYNMVGDQPGDYPTNFNELQAGNDQLAAMPNYNMIGDQPGDYPTNFAELQAGDDQLAAMSNFAMYGDQPGDYPLNAEELQAADNELARMPSFEEYADQPGDYPLNANELAAADAELASMPGSTNSTSFNTKGLQDYLKKLTTQALLQNKATPGGPKRSASRAHAEDFYGETPGNPKLGAIYKQDNAPVGSLLNLPGVPQLDRMAPLGAAPQLGQLPSLGGSGSPNLSMPNMGSSAVPLQSSMGFGGGQAPIGNVTGGTNTPTLAGTPLPNLDLTGRTTKGGKEIKFVNEPKFAADGGMMYADDNGMPQEHNPEFFSEGGLGSIDNRYVKGEGDGTSDSVPAMLANGEFVIPADVVASLGNGSNDSGAQVLDEFLKVIRDHKRKADGKALPPDSKGALGYLLEAKKKAQ
jgi:hypothetical protein